MYRVRVFSHWSGAVEEFEVTDPYSLSLAADGARTQVSVSGLGFKDTGVGVSLKAWLGESAKMWTVADSCSPCRCWRPAEARTSWLPNQYMSQRKAPAGHAHGMARPLALALEEDMGLPFRRQPRRLPCVKSRDLSFGFRILP